MTHTVVPSALHADPQWRAAFAAFEAVGGFRRVAGCVDLPTASIDWEQILKIGWSTTERIMLVTAQSLRTGRGVSVDVGRAADLMDEGSWEKWLGVLRAYRET